VVSSLGAGRTHDIFVVGTSAGGVQALKTLAAGLPADFPGAVFAVIHTAPDSSGLMAQILDREGPLVALYPRDGDEIRTGHIYLAPPDHHLTVGPGHVHLSRAPRENASRPAVNPLFRSAARVYGPRVVGVVLTGTLDDGTAGMIMVEEHGGVTIVQDPEDADFGDMPENVMQFVDVDHVLPLADIPGCLVSLAHRALTRGNPMAKRNERVEQTELLENEALGISCPDCHGSLWEVTEGELVEYRCRIGHLYSPESLMHHLTTRTAEELESTYRAFQEEAAMADKMVERAVARNAPFGRTERFRRRAAAARGRADAVVRAMEVPGQPLPESAD
jgi:two-component system chemotaxis response regulator CheB